MSDKKYGEMACQACEIVCSWQSIDYSVFFTRHHVILWVKYTRKKKESTSHCFVTLFITKETGTSTLL